MDRLLISYRKTNSSPNDGKWKSASSFNLSLLHLQSLKPQNQKQLPVHIPFMNEIPSRRSMVTHRTDYKILEILCLIHFHTFSYFNR